MMNLVFKTLNQGEFHSDDEFPILRFVVPHASDQVGYKPTYN